MPIFLKHFYGRFYRDSETLENISTFINNIDKHPWKAGFSDKFDPTKQASDYKYLLGVLDESFDLNIRNENIYQQSELPDEYDPRIEHPECPTISQIRDQSSCGSCYAFGAAEALSDRFCIASKGEINIELSAQDILACCLDCGVGCGGGWIASTWHHLNSKGIHTGGLYNGTGCMPYEYPPCQHSNSKASGLELCSDQEISLPTCKSSCTDRSSFSSTFLTNQVYKVGSQIESKRAEIIQREIFEFGSVEAAFSVYSDFLTYKSGVYVHTTGSYQGGHAVKIIGWGVDSESGLDYWLVANSWNTFWGEDGFFRIKRGNDECGIESKIYAGVPNLASVRL